MVDAQNRSSPEPRPSMPGGADTGPVGCPGRRAEAARAGIEALEGNAGATFDSLVYGAALCLWHLGHRATLAEAAEYAREVIGSGKALAHFRA